MSLDLSRRSVLQSAAAALTLFACADKTLAKASLKGSSQRLGVYLSIGADNTVTFTTPNAEMGQGTFDSLARMIAEELDADWDSLKIELSGANKAMFNPKIYGQTTGNSLAIQGFGPVVRKAGAAARHMLRQAAADSYNVSFDKISTDQGYVTIGDMLVPYGDLVEAAAVLPVPKDVKLKAAKDFKLIGKPFKRKETEPKITGEAVFGIDVDLPNMAIAALAMPAHAWGKVKEPPGLNEARGQNGVKAVTPVAGGYAVVAEDFWTAKCVADSLTVEADIASGQVFSTEDMVQAVQNVLTSEDAPAALYEGTKEGLNLEQSRADIAKLFNKSARIKELSYSVPILAHGALEPLSATALYTGERLEIWAPTQNPAASVNTGARVTGLDPKNVKVNRTFIGGGFGRKWNIDFVTQAVEAAKALPGTPIKLIWTREQDTQHDFYRPIVSGRLRAGLDSDGNVQALSSIVAGQSLSKTWFAPRFDPKAPDTSLQNAPSYAFDSAHVESRTVDLPLPMGWWRSVSHMPTIFFQESFMDELAAVAGADPFDYRLAHIGDARGKAVLTQLRANLPKVKKGAIGIAYADSYDGYLAAAIHVSLEGDALKLHKIWAVADVGMAVDPRNVKRQIAGGIYFGLGPALDGKVTLEEGVVTRSNLHDIGVLSPAGAPPIAVELMDNIDEAPAGVGEIGTPVIAPALCNAIAAAGGPRIRHLPISDALSVQV